MGAIRGSVRTGNDRLSVLMRRYEESHGPTQIQSRTAFRVAPLRRMPLRTKVIGDRPNKGLIIFYPDKPVRPPIVQIALAPADKPPRRFPLLGKPIDSRLETYLTMVQKSGAILGRQVEFGDNTLIHEARLRGFSIKGMDVCVDISVTSRTYTRRVNAITFFGDFSIQTDRQRTVANDAVESLASLIKGNIAGYSCFPFSARPNYGNLLEDNIYSAVLPVYRWR